MKHSLLNLILFVALTALLALKLFASDTNAPPATVPGQTNNPATVIKTNSPPSAPVAPINVVEVVQTNADFLVLVRSNLVGTVIGGTNWKAAHEPVAVDTNRIWNSGFELGAIYGAAALERNKDAQRDRGFLARTAFALHLEDIQAAINRK